MSNDMKKSIIRKVDSVGRISVLPSILDSMNIVEGTMVLLHIDPDTKNIILKKDDETCVFCGNAQTISSTEANIGICANCRNPVNVLKIVEERYEKQMIPSGRRLVIPFKIRRELNIKAGDKILVTRENDEFIMLNKIIEDTINK